MCQVEACGITSSALRRAGAVFILVSVVQRIEHVIKKMRQHCFQEEFLIDSSELTKLFQCESGRMSERKLMPNLECYNSRFFTVFQLTDGRTHLRYSADCVDA